MIGYLVGIEWYSGDQGDFSEKIRISLSCPNRLYGESLNSNTWCTLGYAIPSKGSC